MTTARPSDGGGYETVIGLEVHVQLLTQSKLFSAASTAFGAPPNSQTTPLCLGLPGSLPVLNRRAVECAIRTGLALGCQVNTRSEWSRKHYFYPDLPKGYQITQYERPVCEYGELRVPCAEGERVVRIRRIHIEEDAGKLVHDGPVSVVDLNRAGTPLLEIVSDPDLRGADEAVEYLKALRDIVVWLGVNDGNLEEGSFRCDANVSVRRRGATEYGTRCELKNLNSFRFIKQAIELEALRHVEVLQGGGAIEQETRLFDPGRGETRPMRSKEDAHDYRYMPEPDLPPLELSAEQIEDVRRTLPELPQALRRRLVAQWALPEYDVGVLTADRHLALLFERCAVAVGDPKRVSNWFMGELARLINETGRGADAVKFTPAQLAELFAAVDAGTISSAAAKEVFGEMFRTGAQPQAVISDRGLGQIIDPTVVDEAIDQALAASPKNVELYRGGRTQLLGFFVGQVMKALKGKGNPKLISQRLVEKLGGPTAP